jgi:hypothetical protein
MERVSLLIPIVALFLAESAQAQRLIIQREDAHELMLDDVAFPLFLPGALAFTPCSECARTTLTVASGTDFFVGERSLPYAEFLRTSELIRGTDGAAQRTPVYVFFDVGSRAVNRLILDSTVGQ